MSYEVYKQEQLDCICAQKERLVILNMIIKSLISPGFNLASDCKLSSDCQQVFRLANYFFLYLVFNAFKR